MTLVSPDSHPTIDQNSTSTTSAVGAAESAEARPGQTFVDTGNACLAARQWREAVVAFEAAHAVRPDDHTIDLALLEAASNAKRKRLAAEVRTRLGERLKRTPDGLTAQAASLVAERNYSAADTAARAALKLDGGNARAWTLLAASYAGLGWFDQSEECLSGARRHGLATPLDLWYVGRATNIWALERARVLLVAFVTAVLAGPLFAMSVAIATPFFTREVRVRRLPAQFRQLAEHHWESETRARTLAFGFSMLFLVLYVVALIALAPGA